MSRVGLHHLSGPRRGATDLLPRLPAVIGSDPAADLVVPGTAPRHARLYWREGDVVLEDAGSSLGTFLAGQPVREAVLRDGDVLELGSGGPKLRFRQEGAARPGLLQSLSWRRAEAPDLSASGAFARALLRGSAARTSRGFRLTLFLVLAVGGVVLAWTFRESWRLQREVARLHEAVRAGETERRRFEERIEAERRQADEARRALESRIEEFRAREDQLNRRLDDAASGEVQSLRGELLTTRERLTTLESERAAGERIIRNYGAGVCLVQGSYAFYDASGRPLRYRPGEDGQPLRSADGSVVLDPGGSGPVHTVDYFGTGFLVDPGGLVLTNRHVGEPWKDDPTAQSLAEAGFRPRFVLFRAFFPREKEPFELELERSAKGVDLALLRIEGRGRRIPVLPLDRSGTGAVAGQPVVVVGYPTGLEAILAKADGAVVREILAAHGTGSERVTEALSQRGLIRPSTTQGHIGDITKTDIVFDAPTTQGGSGGPIFNKSGQVIAVEYAVLQKFGGNAFGIPIRYALELLRPAPKKRAAAS